MRAIYLHGFASGPGSRKAQVFKERLENAGWSCDIPALDGGDFEHLTISGQLAILDRMVADEEVTLLGSSMGGYLAALYAARHLNSVKQVVLLAPAFGFAHRWPERLGDEALRNWEETGFLEIYHYAACRPARVHFGLLADGRKYEGFPRVLQPALVFHGRQDSVVPYEFSLEFQALHPAARVHLYDAGHELTEVIDQMWEETARFLGLRQ